MTTKQTTKLGDPIEYGEYGGRGTYGTTIDPVLEKARAAFPPDSAELEAAAAVELETARFNDWLRSAGRKMRDAGSGTGDFVGFGFLPDNLKNEYEELRDALQSLLVKRNRLTAIRQGRIQQQVEHDKSLEAQKAQKEYMRKRGVDLPADEEWQPYRPMGGR
jgi:hypothetical protein